MWVGLKTRLLSKPLALIFIDLEYDRKDILSAIAFLKSKVHKKKISLLKATVYTNIEKRHTLQSVSYGDIYEIFL